MKKYVIIYAVVCLIIFSAIGAAGLKLAPEAVTLNLTGGCREVRAIKLKNTESRDISFTIDTIILPDCEGISVEYSINQPFVVNSGETVLMEMYINTSMLLLPQQYSITTIFNGEYPTFP